MSSATVGRLVRALASVPSLLQASVHAGLLASASAVRRRGGGDVATAFVCWGRGGRVIRGLTSVAPSSWARVSLAVANPPHDEMVCG